jgi:hypothetical protein
MREPGESTVKTLFALSGNVCAFYDEDGQRPACEQQLTDPSWSRVMGRICHIYGKKPGSARWDPTHDQDGHEFWNLILLCPTHHSVIDETEPALFPPDKLFRMKARAESVRPMGSAWCSDEALDRYARAALATYRRLSALAQSSEAEAPDDFQTLLARLRRERDFHYQMVEELEAIGVDRELDRWETKRLKEHRTERNVLVRRIDELEAVAADHPTEH